jgi:transketolase
MTSIEIKCVQNIRCLAADMVQKANSGHPGAPMGLAPLATILWGEYMKFDAKDPHWHNRDRFVMSNGHGCALQYSLLHLSGYSGMPMEELKQFRQLHSKTPGHPERFLTEGVEVTTGPLGQGISNAVGIALAEAHLAATFNKNGAKVVDHKTYCIVGDGCLMEGVTQEALSFAGHAGLEKLIVIYDDNKISIDGNTDMAFTEEHDKKYQALGFRTITVNDGNEDYDGIRKALEEAQKPCGKPTMIILRTIIGRDSKLENTAKVHGSPLGEENVALLKTKYGRDPKATFVIDDEVYAFFKKAAESGADAHKAWKAELDKYRNANSDLAQQYDQFWARKFPDGWKDKLPRNSGSKPIATRKASENALNVVMNTAPFVIGGSADLTGSNLTRPDGAKLTDFQKATPEGRYIRFGVREHAMCGILNGIDAHGGLIGFGGTFLNFVSYALGSVRLAALSRHGTIYVATHDSIGLGEDGPTHQPIETMAALRAIPNMLVLRPADQTETSAAWALAVERNNGPTVLALSRQNAAEIAGSNFDSVSKGAYVVVEAESPKVIIASSGTEVQIAVEAAKKVEGARVVSFPSFELFEKQSAEYKKSVFPDGVPVLSVEPFTGFGWERHSHAHLGLKTFGESAPAEKVYEHFGITPDGIADKARKLVAHFSGKPAPVLGHVEL